MKKLLLLSISVLFAALTSAMPADTSAYQTQRLKINALLAERSARFGQYDLSLNARSGIFGLQTKNDLKNSNEILRGIILSDNNIFRELKILMNYKDQEVAQVQRNAQNTGNRIEGYMQTIKRLQEQNEELKAQTVKVTEKGDNSLYIIIFLCLIILVGAAFSYSRIIRLKKV